MIENILTQIGSSAVVIAISAYIAKTWVKHQLDKVTAQNSHELAKQIAKLNVHESHLHKRRVEVIEAMYSKMLDAEFSLQNFLVTWWAHSNREEIVARGFPVRGDFSIEKGLEFCEAYTEINSMLHRNALYFDDQFIEETRKAYNPFFDVILSMGDSELPKFPEEFKEIVNVGQAPRKSVISLFREALGVQNQA